MVEPRGLVMSLQATTVPPLPLTVAEASSNAPEPIQVRTA